MEDPLQLKVEEKAGSSVLSTCPKAAPKAGPSTASLAPGELPLPLTMQMLDKVLLELPDGTRNAVGSCYDCFKKNRFTPDEFVRLLVSVSSQSSTLTTVFAQIPPAAAAGGHTACQHVKIEVVPTNGVEAADKGGVVTRELVLSGAHTGKSPAASCGAASGDRGGAKQHRSSGVNDGQQATTWGLAGRRRQEGRRRQLQRFQGSESCRRSTFLLDAMRRLTQQLTTPSIMQLLQAMRQYSSGTATPEAFAERVQTLVDMHGIVIAHDESTERSAAVPKGANPAAADVGAKRQMATGHASQPPAKKKKASSTDRAATQKSPEYCGKHPTKTSSVYRATHAAADALATSFGNRSPLDESTTCSGGSSSASSHGSPVEGAVDLKVASTAAHELSSSLTHCPLSTYLTARVVAEGQAGEGIQVKVLSHTICTKGRFPYHKKAIFAFRQNNDGAEVALMGMYVHEFNGPATTAPTSGGRPPTHHQTNSMTGRAYIECVDSIPILGSERKEHRQQILCAIMHGYLEVVRDRGFRSIHLRVPPPDEEGAHIFNERASHVRLEAMVRLSQWFAKVLDAACDVGIIATVDSSTHILALENFPATVLPPAAATLEQSTDLNRAWALDIKAAAVSATHARLFSAELHHVGGSSPSSSSNSGGVGSTSAGAARGAVAAVVTADTTPLTPWNMTEDRDELLASMAHHGLRFTSLAEAQCSTNYLIRHVVSSRNTSGAAVRGSSTRGGPATRAATGAKSGRGGAGTREEAGATLESDSWVRSRQDAVALDVGCVAVRGESEAMQWNSSPSFAPFLSSHRPFPFLRSSSTSLPVMKMESGDDVVKMSSFLRCSPSLTSSPFRRGSPGAGVPILGGSQCPGLQSVSSPLTQFDAAPHSHPLMPLGALSEAFGYNAVGHNADDSVLFADSFFCL